MPIASDYLMGKMFPKPGDQNGPSLAGYLPPDANDPLSVANAGMMPNIPHPMPGDVAPAAAAPITPVDDSMPDPATVNPPGMDAVPPDQVDYSASPGGPNSLGDPGPFPKKPPTPQATDSPPEPDTSGGTGSSGRPAGWNAAARASSEASYNAAQAAAQQYYANAPNAANLGYGGARVSGYGAPMMTGGLGSGGLGGGIGGGGFPNLGSIKAGGGSGAGSSGGGKFQGPTPPDITGSSGSGTSSGSAGGGQQPVSAAMAAYLNNPGGQFQFPANAIQRNADGTATIVNPGGTNGAGQAAPTGTAAGSQSGGSTGGTTGAATSPGTPSGLLGQLSQSYQDAMNQANTANSQLANQLMSGYGQMLGGATDLLGNVTNQQYKNLANMRDQQKASAQQNLISRGLGNSTIGSSVASGIDQQYAQNYNNLQDQRLNDAIGLITGIEGNQLNTLNSFNLNAPNYGTLAALAQAIGTSGQNPSSSSAVGGTAGGSLSNYTNSYQPTTNLNALPAASGGVSSTNPAAAATAGTNGTGFVVPTIDFNANMKGLSGILQSNAGQSTPAVQNQGYYGLPGPQAATGPSGASIQNYVNYLTQNGQPLPSWLTAGYGTG